MFIANYFLGGVRLKFIIPQNYDFSAKLFGIIDYSTAVLNVVWYIFIFCIVNVITSALVFKIFLFVILCFPVLIFSIVGFNHENILYVLLYLAKYIFSQKLYLYK